MIVGQRVDTKMKLSKIKVLYFQSPMGMAYVMKNWTYMSVILMEEIVVKQLLGILDVTKRDAIVIYLVFQLHLFLVI